MQQLNKQWLLQQQNAHAAKLALPEKIIQFGTGVLLRGLCDGFVHEANEKGLFNGRIVVVKSTQAAGADAFEEQDNLYTVCVRGIENNTVIEKNYINTSISRVINANTHWNKVLACATNAEIEIVFSNTTEAGLVYIEENFTETMVPTSFPAKLTTYLYKRFTHFRGHFSKGLVIVPTELLPNNGQILKDIVLKHAHKHFYQPAFIQWLHSSNYFCNSLVDKIVPGKPTGSLLQNIQQQLPYTDKLLLVAEPYSLWAIEGNDIIKEKLSFATANSAVVIKENIEENRELKLRFLNAAHTFLCAKALVNNMELVKDSMANNQFVLYASTLMNKEINTAIQLPIANTLKTTFAQSVVDRFKNPFIEHKWASIAVEYTSKLKSRCVPLIMQQHDCAKMAECFAYYLQYAKQLQFLDNNNYQMMVNQTVYTIQDSAMHYVKALLFANNNVQQILSNVDIWGVDLTSNKQFAKAVENYMITIDTKETVVA
jgi:tagaturonate reductase